MSQIKNYAPKAIGYFALGAAALWYSFASGTAAYIGWFDKSVSSYVTAANERVVRQSWPALSQNDVRRWLRPIVDADGQVIRTVKTPDNGLVTLLDGNSNNAVDTAEDYVEMLLNWGTSYRFHGDGTVTTGGDKETKVDNRAITGKSKEILSKWNSFLRDYANR